MKKRTNRQIDTREALLQAAIAMFSERGYQGATMEEIARRAGVAKGTPYLHFTDKAELFYAVFERWVKEAVAASATALAQATSARERLAALGTSAIDYMEAHREWYPLSLEVWAASGTPALRERFAQALKNLYAGYRGVAEAIIRAGQHAGEFRADIDGEALAALLTGAVDGLLLQCWFDPDLDAGKMLQGFFDVLIRGIDNPRKGDPS